MWGSLNREKGLRFEWKSFFCTLHPAVHVGHFQEMLHCGICLIGWGARLLQLTNGSTFSAVFAVSFLWRADCDSSVFSCDAAVPRSGDAHDLSDCDTPALLIHL